MWDLIKITVAGMIGSIINYLQPVYNPIIVLGYMFVLDIFFGILTDIIRNNDRLRLRKLLLSVAFLALYLLIIASAFFIGERMDDLDEALYIVKVLTYVFIYFYTSNILRNLHELAPGNNIIAFLDYFLGLQMIKKLPEVAEYLGITKKNKNENNVL
ncbi:hypothetical protein M2459_001333 [Parabacteroides sp. PF5-5]|uniref:hypothetical protein n=1 Tax=unclassified Parabacteroides TaxID=2649774 RepID=UPI002475BD1E|nr:MULTISPECIES: hypothetical protein [unclassified Parabacteroides]MDH6304598.1 hypothetical protein [Parabacteroides sp. PH5-39]MDH6315789.1 hypothetical protein [Parabacteroides sp. PF5-13]MDH6319448.1 hypothetical protein [Parabacteroides sp. PH5-13]MDH6323179.1 hypothetical protein [Parabacteroides sp. PH5-8]MDH6326981.1 hypothetical protein [Parabacteroides sp. PH5-41]